MLIFALDLINESTPRGGSRKQNAMKMKTRMPLYLLDFGMEFKVKSDVYTLVGTAANGMYEARDKFGLIVEFRPNVAVWV